MSLTCVKMSEEVWLTCVTHALSTETEEIMGLLLGDIHHSKNGNVTAFIWGASPQTRSDRRKDRVETNPEQLAAASAQAEISLIIIFLDEDAYKVGRIQVIAFQSSDGKQNYTPRPISLSPVHRTSIIDLDSPLSSSDNAKSPSARAEVLDTSDSRVMTSPSKGGVRSSDVGGFFASADANHSGKSRGSYQTHNSDNAIVDLDLMDMSESMQEAMHRSNLDMSGAEYARKEIPLHVLPALSLLKLDSPLSSYTDLQRVLYEEERAAYNQAILQNMRDGKVHPLTFIHHTSTYQASMCKLMEYCLSPAISSLQDRLRENEIRLGMLTEEAKMLEAEIVKVSKPSSTSPCSGPS